MPAEVSNPRGSEKPPATLDEPSTKRMRRAIAWIKGNRGKVGLCASGALALVGGGLATWLVLASAGGEQASQVTLDAALAALDRGSYKESQDLAQALLKQGTLPPCELGNPTFVLGAAAAYEARETGTNKRQNHYLLAASYLEESRDRGFPPGRQAEGLFLLGESLYHSGQIAASRPVLMAALKGDRERASEIHDLLAAAYLQDANPKLAEALDHNTRFLADRLLSRASRDRGLLRQAQILMQMGKLDECRKELEKISLTANNLAGAIVLRGQILMQEARQIGGNVEVSNEVRIVARKNYEEAIRVLRTAQGHDTLSTQATRKAHYLIGLCFLRLGDYRAALAQFERTRTTYSNTPEAMAAGLHEAEIARQLGHDGEALTAYRRVLKTVSDPKNYSNPWITLDELRAKLLEAYRHYIETENFTVAIQLVQRFTPLFPRAKMTEWTAETFHRWGEALMNEADRLASDESEAIRRQARTQFRRAGASYEELASMETTTRQYTDHLWSSAEDYLAGHDYRDAVKVLKEYLKNETRRRHSQALVNLGEALLTLDRVDDALSALKDCVDFHPRDAAAFRARLLASHAYLEKGEIDKAQGLLEDNLNGVLSPSSKEWRGSLFALGRLLSIDGQYEKAISRLGEAIQRYPDAPETLEARYLMASAYRRSAEAAQEKLKTSQVRNVRLVWTKHVQESLSKALDEYKTIRATLNQRQQVGTLAPEDKTILRNSDFAAGQVQFDLGQYEESIQSYNTVIYRYQSDPAVMLAYQQVAYAYQRMNKPGEARNTLKQAKVTLSRIKSDTSFDTATPFTRQDWEQQLDQQLSAL